MPCRVLSNIDELNANAKKLEELAIHFDKSKFAQESFGYDSYSNSALIDGSLNAKMFDEMVWNLTEKEAHSSIEFKDYEIKKIKKYIDSLDKRYGNRSLSLFEQYFFIPDAIFDRLPQTSIYRKKVQEINNHSNTKESNVREHKKLITDAFKKEAINRGENRALKAKLKVFSSIQELENKYMEAGMNGDVKLQRKLYYQMKEVINKEAGGMVRDFNILMETNKDDLRVGMKIIDKDGTEFGRASNELILAVKKSREILDELGITLMRGMDSSINSLIEQSGGGLTKAQIKNGNHSSPILKSIKRAIEDVERGKKKIELQIKKGNYLPHYSLHQLEHATKTFENFQNDLVSSPENVDVEARIDEFVASTSKMVGEISNRGKDRAKDFNSLYSMNPFSIIDKYANDVISFNKSAFLRENYLKTMKHLSKADTEAIRGMKEYLTDHYKTSILGYTERADGVNKLARTLTFAEFFSKMGFGVRSAIKNGLSYSWYVTKYGVQGHQEAIAAYRTNNSVGFMNKSLNDTIAIVERESGFKFGESDDVNEIFTEGLLPEKGYKVSDVRFDPLKGQYIVNTSKGEQLLETVMNKSAGYAATLQRITENTMRKYMYRVSFYHALKDVATNKVRFDQLGEDGAIKQAQKIALIQVNKNAGDYSITGKAKGMGGSWKNQDAFGQVLMQFMHFPAFFANLQYGVGKNAYESLYNREFKTPEAQHAYRWGGLMLATTALSFLFNTDLNSLLENDTLQRGKNLAEFLTAENEEERKKVFFGNGLTSLAFGPIVSDIIFASQVTGMLSKDDHDMIKLFTGYQEYAELNDDEKAKEWIYRFNVQAGKLFSKQVPNFQRGASLGNYIVDELSLYPSQKTREGNKTLRSAVGLPTNSKRNKRDTLERLKSLQNSEGYQSYLQSRQN